ncbi:MAG: FlgD immunoglobulin-like domain containing protein, partial [Candidatus Poribacteria bacterium]|nr:FlgD immunoglobulin-like domain containing protein [Candidatus Poribacteria bacterium]
NPKTVYGQVLSINGQAKANQLVMLTMAECSPMLARTDQQGFWSLNLGNLKSETGQSYHSQSGETVGLKLLGDNTIHQQTITDQGLQQLKTIRYQQQSDGGITTADRPDQTQLGANYPNPFNPETWIPYQLSQEAAVSLQIYDGQGRLVRKLELGWKETGYYTTAAKAIYWDGRNANGELVSSGVYFYRLQAGNFSQTRKMVILK